MRDILIHWFWPNPGNLYYSDTNAQIMLGVGAAFIVIAIIIRFWRRRVINPVTKKLSRSWASASVWFGVTAVIMTVSRVEMISLLSIRALWIFWLIALIAYIAFQFRQFRARHYTIIATARTADPRDAYLPRKKNR